MSGIDQKYYDHLIAALKQNFLEEFKAGFEEAGDKDYFVAIFRRDVLDKRKSELDGNPVISNILQYMNQRDWLKNIKGFDAVEEYCKSNHINIKEVIKSIAEYKAILLAWPESINQLERTEQPPVTPKQPIMNSSLELNEGVFPPIDFIRVLNVLSELRGFKKTDGTIPTKEEIMVAFGNVVGLDLSEYAKSLSKALTNASEQANTSIFSKMNEKATALYSEKQRYIKK